MTTSAERRIELENHLEKFREIADQRLQNKVNFKFFLKKKCQW